MTEPPKIRQYYFVDENPRGKGLDEHQIAFGPGVGRDGIDVIQCTEEGYIDETAAMLVIERGYAISVADGNLHQAVRCQLVLESWIDEVDDDDLQSMEVLPIPENLSGVTISETDDLTDNQMAPFALSINMARNRDQDTDDIHNSSEQNRADRQNSPKPETRSGRHLTEGRKSIWRKLGQMVGRVI